MISKYDIIKKYENDIELCENDIKKYKNRIKKNISKLNEYDEHNFEIDNDIAITIIDSIYLYKQLIGKKKKEINDIKNKIEITNELL